MKRLIFHKIIYLISLIIIVFFSCCKKYVDFDSNQQAIYNMYNLGDNFSLLKNDTNTTETLNIVITEKYKQHINTPYDWSNTYYEEGHIYLEVKEGSDGGIELYTDGDRRRYKIGLFNMGFAGYKFLGTTSVNGHQYNNVYYSASYNSDYLYFSTDVGILRIDGSDGTTYKLLNN